MEFQKKTKKKFRKRLEEEEDDDGEDKLTQPQPTNSQTKKHKINILPGVDFNSSGTAKTLVENTATRTLDVDGEIISNTQSNTGSYQGLKGYTEFINKTKKQTQSSGGFRIGPLKGTSNVKISSIIDYAAGICKDYKDFGACGFGDTCVFMHDRGDYKQGWELDKDWEDEQRLKEKERIDRDLFDGTVESIIESDDDLPFACMICRGEFKEPVMTKCNHYFCQICALKQFKKSPGCFCCSVNTSGIFNVAKSLLKKIQDKKVRMEEREARLVKERDESEALDIDAKSDTVN